MRRESWAARPPFTETDLRVHRVCRALHLAESDFWALPTAVIERELAFEVRREQEIRGIMAALIGEGGEKSKLDPTAYAAILLALV